MIWKSLFILKTKYNYKIKQLNIIIAFLEYLMKEIVYIEQPYKFEKPKNAKYV